MKLKQTEKTQIIEKIKQEALSKFKEKGWKPNLEYYNKLRPYMKDQFNKETGEIGGIYYLLSPDREFAITMQKRVVHVHARSRNFTKVLNIELIECEINEDGISQGLIQLKWK